MGSSSSDSEAEEASDLVIGDDHESPQDDELPQNIFVSAASQSECSDAVKHYQQTDEFSPFEKFTFSLFAPHFFSLGQGRQLDFALFMSRWNRDKNNLPDSFCKSTLLCISNKFPIISFI
jgi:hypothetical protein